MSAKKTYSEKDIFRCFNAGDPVTVNGSACYWGACNKDYVCFTPTPKYEDFKNFRWSEIKSFESLEETKQKVANEFSEFFKRGWRLVKASYHDKLHTIPHPLLLERKSSDSWSAFHIGKVSMDKYARVITLIRDDDCEALKTVIANPRFSKRISECFFPSHELTYVFFFLRDNTPAPDFVDLEATRYQAFVQEIAPDFVLELPGITSTVTVEPDVEPAIAPELLARLPNMTGFEHSELGTGDCVWASPCHVLADRDLQLNESVHVWAVDRIDGRVLKTVSLKATEATKARVAWPAALVKAIQADHSLVEGSVLLQAGHLSDDAELTENTNAPTSQTFTGYNNVEKSQVDRLWAFDSHCKLLSNLPFKANQVCALTLADAEPSLAERVCIQVRHRTSQHLYESHFFQPETSSTGGSWSKQLCEFLNQHSAMLRAGKRQDDGISITPEEQGNQLWIPQLSDLSVQLESVNWLEHASFTVNAELPLASEVMIAVHDDVTGAPLPGSPFTFRPSAATRAQKQWPSALASQLAGSPLAPYIKLEQASGGAAPTSTWRCLRAGVPLRIWMSEPLASPAWSSRSGEDIDDVLDACLGDESIQLVIESRDTRTGYLCHASSITLSAMESSIDQAAKRATLAKTLEKHLKQNGVVWLELSIDANVSSTSQNIWKVREATVLQLQTILEKTMPTPRTAGSQNTILKVSSIFDIESDFTYRSIKATFFSLHPPKPPQHTGARTPTFYLNPLIDQFISKLANTQYHFAALNILTSPSPEQLCIVLDAQAIDRGFSLVSCSRDDSGLTFDLNVRFEPDEDSASAGILIGITSPHSLWRKIRSRSTIKEVNIETPAHDTLCADMENTDGSELFAFSGSQPHGVSPQTGLFHFHHTVATLSSLSGSAPAIPLAFNYSPLRANEGALGDGFAFSSMSSYDNRKRRLAMSNGTVDELSINDIEQLINGEPLERLGYTLKAAQGTIDELSAEGTKRKVHHLKAFTIKFPNGHEEALGLPQTHDNVESGGVYKDNLKSKINEFIAHIDNALEDLKTPSKDALPIWSIIGNLFTGGPGLVAGAKIDDYEKTRSIQLSSVIALAINTTWGLESIGKDREKLKQVTANRTELNTLRTELKLALADVERNALILVPLQLKAGSRALQLSWQGVKGHVRLNSIKDGVNVLLKAEHSAEPVLKGSQQSVFTLWPETDERCCITLDIKDCLLRRLTRSSGVQTDKPDQRLHFQYVATPALDNVLCCVAEDDGSREVVAYDWDRGRGRGRGWERGWERDWERPRSFPRVALHTFVPGGQQPNTHHAWAWEGEKQITAATRYAHAPVGSDLEQVPSTRWEWSRSADGTTQLARLIEKVPGEQQRITRYVYQTDNTVPKPLRQPRQTEQHITVEALRVATTTEAPQP